MTKAETLAELITGAVGQQNWEAEIRGKASHAGVAPEKGISATLVAATALVEAQRAGWFGKVVKPDGTGTSNPGIFGEAAAPEIAMAVARLICRNRDSISLVRQ